MGSLSYPAVVFWGQYWWCQILWAALWPRHRSGPEAEWGCGLCPGEDEHSGYHQQHATVMVSRLCRAGLIPEWCFSADCVLPFLPKRKRFFWANCTYHPRWKTFVVLKTKGVFILDPEEGSWLWICKQVFPIPHPQACLQLLPATSIHGSFDTFLNIQDKSERLVKYIYNSLSVVILFFLSLAALWGWRLFDGILSWAEGFQGKWNKMGVLWIGL